MGVYYRRKKLSDFVEEGSWSMVHSSIWNFAFSAVLFVGYENSGWNYGGFHMVGIGNAVIGSWLAWKVLGRRTRMSAPFEAKTMPEYF